MSEFGFLFRSTDAARREAMGTPERAQRSLQAWMAWLRDLEAKGHLKDRGRPLDAEGKVVRGKNMVTDGPYAEAKDLLLGFILVEAKDLNEAAALSAGCPIVEAGGGSVEVRPVRQLNV
jgi:hypothetical protein